MPNPFAFKKEDWVETYFVQQVEAHGGKTVKNQRRRGWLDRTVYWWAGCSDLVETKRPKGGVFEPLQLKTMADLQRMGHIVLILHTRELVDEYIRLRRLAHRGSKIPMRSACGEDDIRKFAASLYVAPPVVRARAIATSRDYPQAKPSKPPVRAVGTRKR